MNLLVRGTCILSLAVLFLAGCTKDDFKENEVPVADAGPSKAITSPTSSETLSGTGTDNDGSVVAYLWSQVSGPSSSLIINPGSASTLIEDLVEGVYTFQLMVTDDKGATGVDTAKITVSPAPIQTLELQPANNPLEFQILTYNGQDVGGTGGIDIPVCAWTINSIPITLREILKFDLSSIPANATIISANLYLYSYPAPTVNGNFVDANYGSNNTLLIQQIVSSWSPGTVKWSNQPASTTVNQVIAASTTQSQLDLNLDVKNMVSSMVSGNANYGFMLKLQNEAIYTSRIFVSSYNTTHVTKHPKLVVVYEL
jgi:hypothetical protein